MFFFIDHFPGGPSAQQHSVYCFIIGHEVAGLNKIGRRQWVVGIVAIGIGIQIHPRRRCHKSHTQTGTGVVVIEITAIGARFNIICIQGNIQEFSKRLIEVKPEGSFAITCIFYNAIRIVVGNAGIIGGFVVSTAYAYPCIGHQALVAYNSSS